MFFSSCPLSDDEHHYRTNKPLNVFLRQFLPIAFPAHLSSYDGPDCCRLCLAYLFLDPTEYTAFAKHGLASVLSVVNIQFYSELNYFAPAREATWLLHLWSLSVEIQFYIIFPTLLWWRGRRAGSSWHLVAALAGCFALSLFACIAITIKNPSSAFFLVPTRIWEFL